jgi:hypothetical protein
MTAALDIASPSPRPPPQRYHNSFSWRDYNINYRVEGEDPDDLRARSTHLKHCSIQRDATLETAIMRAVQREHVHVIATCRSDRDC